MKIKEPLIRYHHDLDELPKSAKKIVGDNFGFEQFQNGIWLSKDILEEKVEENKEDKRGFQSEKEFWEKFDSPEWEKYIKDTWKKHPELEFIWSTDPYDD
jgi:hypothetical protein